MSGWWSSLRPRVGVLVRRDELVFTGRTEFTVAPVVWFNAAGQVAAVGQAEGSSLHQLRRVDLLSRDQALAWEGEQGKAAVLLLRYAFALVLLSDKRKYVFRPIVEYSEDAESLRDCRRSRAERIEAFGILARRAGALRVEVPADTAV